MKRWRADRPDEWKMDEFIRQAENLEMVVDYIKNNYWEKPEDAIADIRKIISFLVG